MLGTIMIIHDRMLAEREQEANTDFLTGLLSRGLVAAGASATAPRPCARVGR